MAKCPKCSSKIKFLKKYERFERLFRFYANEEEIQIEDIDTGEDPDFDCPECGETLFTDEDEAFKFLYEKEEEPKIKLTELQKSGVRTWLTMDSHNQYYGLAFEQALTILTTVISRPEKGRAVTDAGMKSLSTDNGLPVCKEAGVVVSRLNEEHGHLRIEMPGRDLSVGDKIEIIPSHGCTTIPLYDRYVVVRNDYVESVMEIYARGASQ